MDFWILVTIAAIAGIAVFNWADYARKRLPSDAGWATAWTVIAVGLVIALVTKGIG